jgi:hypothetical protein
MECNRMLWNDKWRTSSTPGVEEVQDRAVSFLP